MNYFTPAFIVPQLDVLHTKDGRDYDTNNYKRNKTSIRQIKKHAYILHRQNNYICTHIQTHTQDIN